LLRERFFEPIFKKTIVFYLTNELTERMILPDFCERLKKTNELVCSRFGFTIKTFKNGRDQAHDKFYDFIISRLQKCKSEQLFNNSLPFIIRAVK